jgi:hypothetical protein
LERDEHGAGDHLGVHLRAHGLVIVDFRFLVPKPQMQFDLVGEGSLHAANVGVDAVHF